LLPISTVSFDDFDIFCLATGETPGCRSLNSFKVENLRVITICMHSEDAQVHCMHHVFFCHRDGAVIWYEVFVTKACYKSTEVHILFNGPNARCTTRIGRCRKPIRDHCRVAGLLKVGGMVSCFCEGRVQLQRKVYLVTRSINSEKFIRFCSLPSVFVQRQGPYK